MSPPIQKWLMVQFILSAVLERTVKFLTTVNVVLEEYNNCLLNHDFLHNQRFSKIASPRILGGRVNQIDVSNTKNIFSPPSTPVNLEDSCLQFFHWVGAFRNFAKFTIKHLCWSLFLIKLKVSGLRYCSKETPAQVWTFELCEYCELCEIFHHTIFTECSGKLLLLAEKFNLLIKYHSSEQILLEEQLVDSSHDLIFFYSIWVYNIQNLNLCSAVVSALPNLFTMKTNC